jgi:hypothetical protein
VELFGARILRWAENLLYDSFFFVASAADDLLIALCLSFELYLRSPRYLLGLLFGLDCATG